MSDVVAKLHHLLKIALPLPKEGGGMVKVKSETVANIRVLMAQIIEMEQHWVTAQFREAESQTRWRPEWTAFSNSSTQSSQASQNWQELLLPPQQPQTPPKLTANRP
ncbi:hypothetical protein CROQUDRAFT_94355 [Cronartium quercuum f. sp. fusiforme G11]|uniref:Uncharacterized protein n=1 Tax=Cronartium quercuum f. sp. fusiforme G11 TaxID=708437 RepID=A0A9P6NK53_9BASI|nr:hypothetical protein CROQUDRAFT_94355 [Cronartium quercuum f. sp. fusiforme G11]